MEFPYTNGLFVLAWTVACVWIAIIVVFIGA